MSKNFRGINGKIAGLAVKGMIREVEERMAAGEQIETAPEATTPHKDKSKQ